MAYQRNLDRLSLIEAIGTAIPPHHDAAYLRRILETAPSGSSIRGFFRTGSTWAEQYTDLQDAINRRHLQIIVVIADDGAIMATADDFGRSDVRGSAEKFRRICVSPKSHGEFRLYRNPIFLPMSYVAWKRAPGTGEKRKEFSEALLTAGAGLSKADQKSLMLRDPLPFKFALDQIFANVLKGSRLEFVSAGSRKSITNLISLPLPRGFIGSSRESLPIAAEVQQALNGFAQTTVWNQGVFRSPFGTLDSLLEQLGKSDFGVFVFSADDVVKSRGSSRWTVRDNVLFEYGLFVGRLGKTKNWFLVPSQDKNLIKIASDLVGTAPILYETKEPLQLPAAIGKACQDIRVALKNLGR